MLILGFLLQIRRFLIRMDTFLVMTCHEGILGWIGACTLSLARVYNEAQTSQWKLRGTRMMRDIGNE